MLRARKLLNSYYKAKIFNKSDKIINSEIQLHVKIKVESYCKLIPIKAALLKKSRKLYNILIFLTVSSSLFNWKKERLRGESFGTKTFLLLFENCEFCSKQQ